MKIRKRKKLFFGMLVIRCPKCGYSVSDNRCDRCSYTLEIPNDPKAGSFGVKDAKGAEAAVRHMIKMYLNSWSNQIEGAEDLVGMVADVLNKMRVRKGEEREVV